MKVNCAACGVELERELWRVKLYKNFVCNRKCMSKWNSNKYRGLILPKRFVRCATCGAEVKKKPGLVKKYTNVFCNRICMGEWNAVNYRKLNPPKPCRGCGKLFKDSHKRTKYCCRSCRDYGPTKDTIPEKLLQDELSSRGYGYYKHHHVTGQPDIAFPDKKIAVFADGDYYHANPDKRYFKHDENYLFYPHSRKPYTAKEKRERDKHVTETLRSQGWTVLRYWDHNIRADTKAVVDSILLRLKQSQ